MKYAVQYARPGFFGAATDIVEDTNPISYEEAIAIYKKRREEFIKFIESGESAQLVIWEDVGDGEFPEYGSELVDLDTHDNLKVYNDTIYKVTEVKIEEPS